MRPRSLEVCIKCTLLLQSIFLVLLPLTLANSEQTIQQQQHNETLEDVEQPNVVLASILEHQRALTRYCESVKASKIASMMKRPQDPRLRLDPARPLTYQLPAICLFVLNWEPARGDKLDMINWYSSALKERHHSADWTGAGSQVAIEDDNESNGGDDNNNRTKRAIEPSPNQAHLFKDYLFDVRKWNMSDQVQTRSLTAEERLKQHEADELAENAGFKEAIGEYKNMLESDLSPVILVPGLLGSRLQARLDKSSRVNVLCSKQTSKWQELWLSVKNFLPLLVDCWFDNARMVYDPVTKFTQNAPGVSIRVPDFGSVESVRAMDTSKVGMTKYFADIIDHYTRLGYTPDKNLLAAPYDFRLAPQQLGDYFAQLDQLITKRAQQQQVGSARAPVTLVCHSMGCNNMLIYLRDKSPEWRQRYVRKLIALSGPWGGAFKALKALIVGDQLDLPLVSEIKMRSLARSMPAISYLLPLAQVFAKNSKRQLLEETDNEVGEADAHRPRGPLLVQAGSRRYHVTQVNELLRDLNLTNQLDWFEQTSSLVRPYEPIEGLRVDCLHGQNVPTMESLVFKSEADFPDGPYELVQGEGDGTVNIESLKVCEEWEAALGSKLVRNFAIYNTNHLGVMSHKHTLKHLTQDVLLDD